MLASWSTTNKLVHASDGDGDGDGEDDGLDGQSNAVIGFPQVGNQGGKPCMCWHSKQETGEWKKAEKGRVVLCFGPWLPPTSSRTVHI